MSGDVDKRRALSEKSVDRRNKACPLLVAEDYIALIELLHFIRERLRHTARKHYNSRGIIAAYPVNKLAVFSVADRGYGAGIYDKNVRKILIFRGSSRIASDSYWFTLHPRVTILKSIIMFFLFIENVEITIF